MENTLVIGHLFKEQLNAYGDAFNLQVLVQRLKERGIGSQVMEYTLGEELELSSCDLLYMGGGDPRSLRMVVDYLRGEGPEIQDYLEKGGVLLATGSSAGILGAEYLSGRERLPGLGLLEQVVKEDPGKAGSLRLEGTLGRRKFQLQGYAEALEVLSHEGTPLCQVERGGELRPVGFLQQGVVAVGLYGPVLALNKDLADHVLGLALEKRFGKVKLKPLGDALEQRMKKKGR